MDTTLRNKTNYFVRRLTYWYDPKTCQFILPDGTMHKTSEPLRLVPLMNNIENHARTNYEGTNIVNLYIRAGNHSRYKPDRYWFHVGCDWQDFGFSYDVLQCRYERNAFTIWMHGTGAYFGDEQDIIAIYNAYQRLEKGIEHYFQRGDYMLLSTPSVTGRDLLEFCLPKGHEYETLPSDLQDLISQNFGQSRSEHMAPKSEFLDEVYVIDGAWMYASCVSHLPVGKYIHDTVDDIETRPTSSGILMPKYPGLYRVTFTVPNNWSKVGILKAPPRHENDESYYPNEPGQTFTNWTTGNELALAIDQGWTVTIHERIIWPETEKQPDPFAKWRKILVQMREDATKMGTKQGKLLAVAIRNIFIHTIGSLNSSYRYEEVITPRSEIRHTDFSQRAKNKMRRMTKDGLMWKRRLELPEHKRKFYHPEWPAIVWGRCRTRITSLALRIPYNDIIGIRTDCIWSASKPDFLLDKPSYKPGEFRVKDHIERRFRCPISNDDFITQIQERNLELEKMGEIPDDDGFADVLLYWEEF